MKKRRKYSKKFKNECKSLRRKGYSLKEIVKLKKVPVATLHEWIGDIVLSPSAQKRIQKRRIQGRENAKKSAYARRRKLKYKPQKWSNDLICLVAHFLFDGRIERWACSYSSRNKSQIEKMENLIKRNFDLTPRTRIKNGVIEISYCHANLADYLREKTKELLKYIPKASKYKKKIFLQAFFDDEGCISYEKHRNMRRVRGYQHSKDILELIQKLLAEFDIESRIDKRFTEITIGRKENLLQFQKHINFSPNIFINPYRKNSIWKIKIDKRTILQKALTSYQT